MHIHFHSKCDYFNHLQNQFKERITFEILFSHPVHRTVHPFQLRLNLISVVFFICDFVYVHDVLSRSFSVVVCYCHIAQDWRRFGWIQYKHNEKKKKGKPRIIWTLRVFSFSNIDLYLLSFYFWFDFAYAQKCFHRKYSWFLILKIPKRLPREEMNSGNIFNEKKRNNNSIF